MIRIALLVLGFGLFSTSLSAAESDCTKGLTDNEIDPIIIKIHQQVVQGGYQLMSVSTLKQRVDNHSEFVLIDAQPYEHYRRAFIKGAINFEFRGAYTGHWSQDAANAT